MVPTIPARLRRRRKWCEFCTSSTLIICLRKDRLYLLIEESPLQRFQKRRHRANITDLMLTEVADYPDLVKTLITPNDGSNMTEFLNVF